MDAIHLLHHVVRPTLEHIEAYSVEAEQLIMGTIWQESAGGIYLVQLGGGPARGIIQMEPSTHHDIWNNFLNFRSALSYKIKELLSVSDLCDEFSSICDTALIYNLAYQIAMCRIHYLRVPEPLPSSNNIEAMAAYWKQYYNTPGGKGTEKEFINHFPREIL